MLGFIIAEIWLCLLIAALIGFVVGWLLRGTKSTSSESGSSMAKLNASRSLQTTSVDYTTLFEGMRTEIANLSKRIAPYETVLLDRESRIKQLQHRVEVLETRSVQEANVISETETKSRKLLRKAPSRKRVRQFKKDDLKLIVGIGPVLERRLNKLGIYRFKQIARWTEKDIGRIAEQLKSFGDRITRERWVEGAKKLHKEKYNEDI